MIVTLSCLDRYEAQKLSGLVYIVDKNESLMAEVIDVFDNEVVLRLKDESAHSVIFTDNTSAEKFTDFIQSIKEGKHKITNTKLKENLLEITKE